MSGKAGSQDWPVTIVWGLLVTASAAGFLLAEGLASARIAVTAAFLLAALKIHLIVSQYMELRRHHAPLRLLFDLWLAAVTMLLLVTYWIA